MSSNSYHSRPSSHDGLSAGASRLVDKQREWTAFMQIHDQSQNLLKYFEQFGDKYDILDGGSEAVGDVVEHWQTVFRATHLALASLQAKTHPTSAEDPTPVLPPNALPDRLVRIPVQEPELPGQQGAATQGQLDTAE